MKWARRWWAGLHFNIRNRIHSLTVPYENHMSNQWSFLIGPQPLSSLVNPAMHQKAFSTTYYHFNLSIPFYSLFSSLFILVLNILCLMVTFLLFKIRKKKKVSNHTRISMQKLIICFKYSLDQQQHTQCDSTSEI